MLLIYLPPHRVSFLKLRYINHHLLFLDKTKTEQNRTKQSKTKQDKKHLLASYWLLDETCKLLLIWRQVLHGPTPCPPGFFSLSATLPTWQSSCKKKKLHLLVCWTRQWYLWFGSLQLAKFSSLNSLMHSVSGPSSGLLTSHLCLFQYTSIYLLKYFELFCSV